MQVQTFNEFNKTVFEKDEHKKSSNYKKLTPKMKNAVDELFSTMEKNPSDFLTTFDKTVKIVSKKYGVKEKDIMNYFDKEMLSI
jgi:flagellum-specific peptidoglycan hydrolase FlgJ